MRSDIIVAFLNGLTVPLPGSRSIDKQIDLELKTDQQRICNRLFALGHLCSAFPLVFTLSLALYESISRFNLHELL